MASFWWASVSQETTAVLFGVLVFSWVVGVVYRNGKSYKAMLCESVLLGCVPVRSTEEAMEVSR